MNENQTGQTTQSFEVAVIENSLELLKAAPQVLADNRQRSMKAIIVGNKLLDKIIEAGTMTPELDQKAKEYLVNVKAAITMMNEKRTGITQIMDTLKGWYTLEENQLDVSKPNTIPWSVQQKRNEYAKKVAEEAEALRQRVALEAKKKQAIIDTRLDIEKQLTGYLEAHLTRHKTALLGKLNDLKLETFADDAAAIRLFKPAYKKDHFEKFAPVVVSPFLDSAEKELLVAEMLTEEKFNLFSDRYVQEMTEQKQDIVSKIPSKHEELKEQKRLADEQELLKQQAEERRIALEKEQDENKKKILEQQKVEAEKKRIALEEENRKLEEEKRIREENEKKELDRQAAESTKIANEQSEIAAQGEKTMTLFDQQVAVSGAPTVPETKTTYDIEVKHPVAYTQIFAYWFEKVGKDLPLDKLGGTKLESMKSWCEKDALKGNKIDSKYLEYKLSYSAVNRKEKTKKSE